MGLLDSADKGDEGSGKLRYSMVWPGGEVVLGHRQWSLIRLSGLGWFREIISSVTLIQTPNCTQNILVFFGDVYVECQLYLSLVGVR